MKRLSLNDDRMKMYNEIKKLADKYKNKLQLKVDERIEEMNHDDELLALNEIKKNLLKTKVDQL